MIAIGVVVRAKAPRGNKGSKNNIMSKQMGEGGAIDGFAKRDPCGDADCLDC